MPIGPDPRDLSRVLIGGTASDLFASPAPAADKPAMLDTLAAAARQMSPGAAYEALANRAPGESLLGFGDDAPPGYDPLDHIQGYEDHARAFVDAHSPADVQGIKSRLDQQRRDQQTLERAGLGGTLAGMGLQVLDPVFLASVAVPEIAIAKAARMARVIQAGAEGAAGAGAYEIAMHNLQEDRSWSTSALNIGVGALLSGTLGGLLARVPKDQSDALRSALAEELHGAPSASTAGAAAVTEPLTAEQESLAAGARAISKFWTKVPFAGTDLSLIMNSSSSYAKVALQNLAEVVPILGKNLEDIRTPDAVESLIVLHQGKVADFADGLRNAWIEYRARALTGERLSKGEFAEAVASASRSGDFAAIPEVAKAARQLREVFDNLKREAQELKLLPEDVPTVGAESYFRRMYDRRKIQANMALWRSTLTDWFVSQGADRLEAAAATSDVTDKILRADVGRSNWATKIDTPTAGPLKERTLNIPDYMIEPFLVNDPVRVASAYVRDLAPQIEITKRFGDKEMTATFQRISDEYNIQAAQVERAGGDQVSEKLAALKSEQTRVQEALIRVRDRLNGTISQLGPKSGIYERAAVLAARGWRNWVAATKMGMVGLTGSTGDLSRIMATYGFTPTITKLAQLAASREFRTLTMAKARRLGVATEIAMSRRLHAVSDGALTEGWTQRLAETVYKYGGTQYLTDLYRTLTATLFEDSVIKAAATLAAGGSLDAHTATRLAAAGLGKKELAGIHEQVQRFGGTYQDMHVSGSALWHDGDLARIYDAAVIKESRVAVMQPGAADRTWWMDAELGKVLGQIKSFAIATPMRMLVTPIQNAAQGNYLAAAKFTGFMMAGGYLMHAVRQTMSGRVPDTDPAQAALDAWSESGLGGVLPDLMSPFGRRLGVWGAAKYSDSNMAATFGGPSAGTIQDTWQWLMSDSANGVSAKDLHKARRLLPFQNLWWARRAINAVEGELAEGLDLKGADHASVAERLMRTERIVPRAELLNAAPQ